MPKCPHCKGTVSLESATKDERDEVQRDAAGVLKKEVMYSCPHCECVLGFAFFIGGLATGRP